MKRTRWSLAVAATLVAAAAPVDAQGRGGRGGGPGFTTDDPVIQQMWQIGMEQSQIPSLAQTLLDSVGPRLTGSPGHKAGNDWLVKMYTSWGIPARNEQYGTWEGWRRGITHVDLIRPRVRSLEGMMLAWSPGTPGGRPLEGAVVTFPDVADSAAFAAWLPSVRGRFVAFDFAQPTCRPASQWQEYAAPGSFERMQAERTAAQQAYQQRIQRAGFGGRGGANTAKRRLEEAGAAGLLQSNWSNDYGVNKIFSSATDNVPSIDLSCEDYGLVFRLAENDQGPVVRVQAESEHLGEVPVFNTVAEIRGTERPNEYILLSAHFDSWDGSSGATDNGTGTLTMLEAMRILKQAYPNPKRTIMVGHWGGEEQGLNGSRAFSEDHPEIVAGLQALLNQDNGTGRVVNMSGAGLVNAGAHIASWLSRIPSAITGNIDVSFPGSAGGGGSDHASFACHGAPAFSLGALSWGYSTYTWHTNRDTFDKVVIDDVKNNATLTAMLAYLASEDPEMISRERRSGNWPECQSADRSSGGG